MIVPNRRLLIVDDSLIIRAMIERVFDAQDNIRVMGVANDVAEAYDQIERLRPDVLTLDIEMPGVDGLSLLADIMRQKPIPVVIVSGSASPGNHVCAKALAMGASDCFDKAKIMSNAAEFIQAVRKAKVGTVTQPPPRDD